jgi:hypothetical protein
MSWFLHVVPNLWTSLTIHTVVHLVRAICTISNYKVPPTIENDLDENCLYHKTSESIDHVSWDHTNYASWK